MGRPFLYICALVLFSSAFFVVPRGSAASTPEVAVAVPSRILPPPPSGGNPPPGPFPLDAPFGANVRVSETTTSGNQNEITVAVQPNGRLHMAWNDYRAPNPDYRCGYSYSTDGGQTWSANQLFHAAGFDADGDPVLFTDSLNNVYLVCLPFDRAGSSQIVIYKSTDGGVTWGPYTTVSDTPSGFADKPWATAVGTTLFVCYTNFVGGGDDLRFTSSTDGGTTWAPTRVLDSNGQGCTFASNTAGTLYLAWSRGGANWAWRSTDLGGNWSAAVRIGLAPWTDAPDERANPFPSMAAFGSNVYVVWGANDGMGTWDVRFARSLDGGATWGGLKIVNAPDQFNRQFMPAVSVDALGTVHVVWYDNRTGLMAIRYAASSDAGTTWFPSLRVTDTEWNTAFFIGDYIQMLVDPSGHVCVGWTDHRSGENEAYFASSSAIGPPALARIDVTPPSATTDADTPVTFTANGFDQYEQPYASAPTWAATGGGIAGGMYTPSLTGDWQVWANESGFSGSANVHVTPGALTRIDVTPPSVTITADDVQQYTATGYDAHDNVRPIAPAWGVSDGGISGGGLFTPRHVGTWSVYANDSGIVGSTTVTVTPGILASIVVSPPSPTITADQFQQFNAVGYDAKGNVLGISPTWAASGGAVDAFGFYSPSIAGTWSVYANDSGVSGSALVTVLPGTLRTIDVTPKNVTVAADLTVQYTARGYDAKGNEVPITPTWTVSPNAGAIDAAGLYTPARVGTWTVTATDGAVSGWTAVTVQAGPLARIDVAPSPITITADQILPLTATGYDMRGNVVPIAPTWAATCGTVDASGVYTPGPARLCVAYANQSGISGAAQITVTAGRLTRIDVTPPTSTITADQFVDYTATGYDAKGNTVPISPTWSAAMGTIDAGGHYTPSQVGTWQVTATAGSISGTATVTVTVGIIFSVEVTPSPVTITADDTKQFQAVGKDRAGNPVPFSGFAWSVDNGTIVAGLFTPYRVGDWTVTATALSEFPGTAHVTVTPGKVARVVITPPSAHLAEGGVASFSASAFDAKGNSVPTARFSWRAEGGVGDVDGSGRFTATHGGQGQVVVTATGGGGSASASASLLVDAPAGVSSGLVLGLIALVAAIAFAVLMLILRRRRKKDAPPPP
ncbi:MAG: hypothetical protein E6K18_04385 [Methanobacteriota archaeon]|nr:MAG: hypothetical protein E6K18_04385 [Euryarchaeota archaeon]